MRVTARQEGLPHRHPLPRRPAGSWLVAEGPRAGWHSARGAGDPVAGSQETGSSEAEGSEPEWSVAEWSEAGKPGAGRQGRTASEPHAGRGRCPLACRSGRELANPARSTPRSRGQRARADRNGADGAWWRGPPGSGEVRRPVAVRGACGRRRPHRESGGAAGIHGATFRESWEARSFWLWITCLSLVMARSGGEQAAGRSPQGCGSGGGARDAWADAGPRTRIYDRGVSRDPGRPGRAGSTAQGGTRLLGRGVIQWAPGVVQVSSSQGPCCGPSSHARFRRL
jgi:hypothetical protein